MTWLWRHSQRHQVNNVTAFENLNAKLCFSHVLKRCLSAHLTRVKILLFTFYFLFDWRIACSFCRKAVWTDVTFLDGSVFKNRIRTNFGFSHIPRNYTVQFPTDGRTAHARRRCSARNEVSNYSGRLEQASHLSPFSVCPSSVTYS